jgi:hypothetical protein
MTITKITHDVNGNPRRVVHFLDLVTDQDRKYAPNDLGRIPHLYRVALNRSRKIGGKKYSTKSFGGGIVFQSYSDNELEKDIARLLQA